MKSTTFFTPRVWLLLVVIAAVLLLPTFAHAANGSGAGLLPTTGVEIPGTSDNDSWVKKFGYLIRYGIFFICICAVGFGMGDSIFGIFRTINDARHSGEWGPAIKQILLILLAVVIAFVLFAILNTAVFATIEKFFT